MSTVCAEGGRYLKQSAIALLEKNYMAYRESYNCHTVAFLKGTRTPLRVGFMGGG